ncbi:MAG: amidohydrolase, partial [Thalassotalea sp.]|nr:amidohydrolase [Thalassotalea sp.]
MKAIYAVLLSSSLSLGLTCVQASELSSAVDKDYKNHLGSLWDHFHRNPELSLMEKKTAKRLAQEIRSAGFTVTENIGG